MTTQQLAVEFHRANPNLTLDEIAQGIREVTGTRPHIRDVSEALTRYYRRRERVTVVVPSRINALMDREQRRAAA